MKNTRLFIVGGAVILFSLVIAFVTQRNRPTANPPQNSTLNLNISHVVNPALSGTLVSYYDSAEGKLTTYNIATKQVEYSLPLQMVAGAQYIWSPDGTSVITIDPVAVTMINMQTGVKTPLNRGISLPTWSSDSKRLLYEFLRQDLSHNTLVASDNNGQNFNTVFDTSTRYEALWWGSEEQYAVGLDSTGPTPRYVRLLLSSKRAEPLADGYGDLRFSPAGKRAIIDSAGNSGIGLVDIESGSATQLSIKVAVALVAWESETTLIAINADKQLLRINVPDGKISTIRNTSIDTTNTSILGIASKQVILFDGSNISNLSL